MKGKIGGIFLGIVIVIAVICGFKCMQSTQNHINKFLVMSAHFTKAVKTVLHMDVMKN